MENQYEILRNKQEKEVHAFPIAFAYNDKQFEEAMKGLGLTPSDTDKIFSIGTGCYIRKTDSASFDEMSNRHEAELKEAIKNDATGEGFILDMFSFELANHEYLYTREMEPTLEVLGLTMEEIQSDEKLSKGLKTAISNAEESLEDEIWAAIADE